MTKHLSHAAYPAPQAFRRPPFAAALLACLLTTAAHAQQMPGMTMPAQPAKPAPGKPNKTPNPPDPAAADLQQMQHDSDQRARAVGSSEQQSIDQQRAQEKPDDHSDQSSITQPTLELQEPEAPGYRTGGNLPAPELLGELTTRQPMTLEAFLHLADTTNPTLAEAQRNIDRSLAQARQSGLPPDPTVGYSGDHIRGGSYHGGEEGAFFSQEFVLGRKLALRRDIYRVEGKANQYALEAQRARVHNDVARAFFDALAAQQNVILHDRMLANALDASTNTHELARVGQADAAQILSAEIAAEQAKIDFTNAQRMFLAAFARLATTAGQLALAPAPLTGELVAPPEFDPSELVARDVAESPLVAEAQATVHIGEARLKDARRERVPNLNVTAGEWYSGEELNTTGKRTGWMSFAQAGVQLPLWNRNQGNIAAAQAELDRARQDVRRTQLWTRNQAEPLAQQYQTARFTADRYRTELLPRARRAYQLEATKYQQMALAYPEVLAAQRMLYTLQMSYVEALNQQWHAAIALENYALADGLDAPMSNGSDATTLNLPTASANQ